MNAITLTFKNGLVFKFTFILNRGNKVGYVFNPRMNFLFEQKVFALYELMSLFKCNNVIITEDLVFYKDYKKLLNNIMNGGKIAFSEDFNESVTYALNKEAIEYQDMHMQYDVVYELIEAKNFKFPTKKIYED